VLSGCLRTGADRSGDGRRRCARDTNRRRRHHCSQVSRGFCVSTAESDVDIFSSCIYLEFLQCFDALLVGRQEGHPACKKTEWWRAGVVIRLERCADLHTAQLMPLPLTVSCFSKMQIGFTFLVQAYLGSPGKRAVKRMCVIYLEFHSWARYTVQSRAELKWQ